MEKNEKKKKKKKLRFQSGMVQFEANADAQVPSVFLRPDTRTTRTLDQVSGGEWAVLSKLLSISWATSWKPATKPTMARMPVKQMVARKTSVETETAMVARNNDKTALF